MSTLRYSGGEYNSAQGTRDAFGRFSDDLVRAGLPGIVVVSGDRETATQVRIFTERFRQQSSGNGPFGDVRYWDGSAWGYPGGTRWVRHSSAGTVAVPTTSTHEKRRSNDLGWPYNSVTTSHIQARDIARRHNIVCDGLNFGEPWHWTFNGALGVIGSAAGGWASAREWDEMSKQEVKDAFYEVLTEVRLGPGNRNLYDSLKFEAGMIADVAKTVNAIRADVNYIHQVSPWSLKAIREAASDGRVSLTEEQARAIAGQLSSVAVESLEAALADDFEGVKARIAALPGETIAALKAAL